MSYISFKNVIKSYGTGDAQINALDGVDFEIEKGEFCILLGSSGAGKTTLLNMLGGMDSITSGEILFDGRDVSRLSRRELATYRRHDVGFVFQFYNLMPNLTALENVELATEMCKNALSPEEVLKSVGLEERMANFPSQLSGGEQQRVSIARAIAKNPRILLCDEPTGALDYATGKTILKLLHDACKQHGKTVIIVTHNSALKEMADKVIYIKNGQAVKTEIVENPKDVAEIEW
jgi:putative ABC transport system ATP-binding protein